MSSPYHPLAAFTLAAAILRQCVDDAAYGVAKGLLDQDLQPVRKPGMPTPGASVLPSDLEVLEGARLLHDGRARHLCHVLSTHAPRSPIAPPFLRRLAVRLAPMAGNRGPKSETPLVSLSSLMP